MRESGQKVVLIDTGIAAAYTASCPGCVSTVGGNTGLDESGHGTALAALLAGVPSLGFSGVAGDAKVAIVPLAPHHGDVVKGHDVALAIDAAVQDGYDVINISLGSQTPDPAVGASVARAINAGAIIVAAAGEDPDRRPLYPASFPGVVSVRSAADGALPSAAGVADGRVIIPIHRFEIPRYDPEMETFSLGLSSESSEASAVVAGIAAVHRGLKETCPQLAEFGKFVIESLTTIGQNAASPPYCP